MAIWDDVITDEDREIYRKAGYGGGKINLGQNPALVIIDVTYNFVGDKPEPILKSMERFPLSCGDRGWKAVNHIVPLLALAREKQIPVIYSTNIVPVMPEWLKRNIRGAEAHAIKIGTDIVREIAPVADDIVIHKSGPSIFLGTPLVNILIPRRIDSLLICGGTTSGCVRGSVTDAATYGFKVAVVEECVFDRGEVSHKVNLFDMNAKYAIVMSIAETKDYLSKLPGKQQA